jgi:hypothetical protein
MAYEPKDLFTLLDEWTSLTVSTERLDSCELIKAQVEAGADISDGNVESNEEMKALLAIAFIVEAIEDEVANDEWRYGITFIPERDFANYAQELAEERTEDGANLFSTWPTSCIDWEYAARELSEDYTSIEIGGSTYLYRSC